MKILTIAILIAILIIYWARTRNPGFAKLGIEGRLIWIDRGRKTGTLYNRTYGVSGKPDFIFRQRSGLLGVEYKSRRGPVYESDIVQAKVAALAARGEGYAIASILIKTASMEKWIDLPPSDSNLYKDIESFVELVRRGKMGAPLKAKPTVGKCRSCGYRLPCTERM